MNNAEIVELPNTDSEKVRKLASGLEMVHRWRRILSLRLIAFIALACACVVWTLTVADPSMWRFIASCGYSVGVLVPSFVLCWKAAD